MSGRLGRLPPPDWQHMAQYPLRAAYRPDAPTPVVLGVNWYSNFDAPVIDHGRYWIGRGPLGRIRGGHAILARTTHLRDLKAWWEFYDQGDTPACVGYSVSRLMSHLNRRMYDAEWLYAEAQKNDQWPGEDYDGTTVRAGFTVLCSEGHRRVYRHKDLPANPDEGISAFRWTTSVDQIHAVLQSPLADQLGAVPLCNSWGEFYPHTCWLPDDVLDRLLREEGEAGTVTDR